MCHGNECIIIFHLEFYLSGDFVSPHLGLYFRKERGSIMKKEGGKEGGAEGSFEKFFLRGMS